MATAEELIVAITSEGVSETRDDLEGVESAMEDTADSAGNSAEELEGFSQRFQGALSAAVAALAVGAAGVLSQVPAIGEAMSGLFAIVEALAFQMDSVLRPALSPITDFFFDVANAIFEADGALGTLIGVIGSLLSIGVILIPTIAAIGSQIGIFATTSAGVVSILGSLAGVVGTVATAIAGLPVAIALGVAAIVAFATAYAFNLGGVRDITNDLLGQVWDFFVGLASDLSSWAGELASDAWDWGSNLVNGLLDGIRDFGSGIFEWFTDLASDLTGWAADLADSAFDWGSDLIDTLLDGIRSGVDGIGGVMDTVAGEIDAFLPSSDADTGPLATLSLSGTGLIQTLTDGISGGVGTVNAAITEIVESISDSLDSLLEKGRSFTMRFRSLMQSFAERMNAIMSQLVTEIKSHLAEIEVAIPDEITVAFETTEVGTGVNGQDTASQQPRFGAGRATSTRGQQIDGRQISESTGRYRADPSNRRGL